jgi:filamentous hemagglutinin
LKTQGNVAVADVHVEGLPSQLSAHSGIDEVMDGFVGSGSGNFDSLTIDNAEGRPIGRNIDSEYKILDNVADMLKGQH